MPSLLGYPSSYRAPFTALQILFGQGPSNAAAGPRTACYIGPMTAAGTGTVNTRYTISSELDAITWFGNGSPLHRMIRAHLLSNTLGPVVGIGHAASSGAGVATATATITITMTSGANPTATGNLNTTVCGESISTSFNTSDTVTTIAAALRDQINAKVWLPCTAGASAGVLTLTAKIAGASQGDGAVGVIRFRSIPDPGKNVVATASGGALGLGSGTAGADGATTEVAGLTSALNTITNTRYYYLGFSSWSSSALTPISSHVSTKSQANPGLRGRAFTGYTAALSAAETLAIALNFERHHIVNQINSEWDTAYLVGNTVAVHQKLESVPGGFVPDLYRATDWLCPAAYAASDWPSGSQPNDAVTDGVMQIGSDPFGSFILMSVNTRSRDATGAIDDFRAIETHRVSFMDYVGDTWLLRDGVQYGTGFKLQADQLNPDGSVNFNQRVPPKTLTPSLYKPFAAAILNEMVDSGILQNSPAWLASLSTFIDPNNVSRLWATASGRTVDIRHQTAIQLSEATPG